MPLMCGWFTSPCTTSPTHATEQLKGAAEGRVVRRREAARSTVSGKSLARSLHGRLWTSVGPIVRQSDRKRLATSGARAGPTKGVGLRSAADLGARPARPARAARGHELAPAQTDRLISGTLK